MAQKPANKAYPGERAIKIMRGHDAGRFPGAPGALYLCCALIRVKIPVKAQVAKDIPHKGLPGAT
jgi:hypothetical protein